MRFPTSQLLVRIAAQARQRHAKTLDDLEPALQETIRENFGPKGFLDHTYLKCIFRAAELGTNLPTDAVIEGPHPNVAARMEDLQGWAVAVVNSDAVDIFNHSIKIATNRLTSEIAAALNQSAPTPCDITTLRQWEQSIRILVDNYNDAAEECDQEQVDIWNDRINTAEAKLAELVRWSQERKQQDAVKSPLEPKIIVALDCTKRKALEIAGALDPEMCRLKVGPRLFTSAGPEILARLHIMGYEIFLDLKLHDIPSVVGETCRIAAQSGVWMISVHASGGRAMLQAAKQSATQEDNIMRVVGCTVLTSLSDNDLADTGIVLGVTQKHVFSLASLSNECGLDGIICSAQDLSVLSHLPPSLLRVTPGIRPSFANRNQDQHRVASPEQAIQNGADYLVIGRPIVQAADPAKTLARIYRNINNANSK